MCKSYGIIIIITMLIFSSCNSHSKQNEADNVIAEQLATQIINCINDEDTLEIKKMFCVSVQNSETIDDEISGIFNIISANIDSYDTISCNSGKVVSDGEITRQQLTIYIEGICAGDNVYNIIMYDLNICLENEELIGLSEIDIYDAEYEKLLYVVGNYIRA